MMSNFIFIIQSLALLFLPSIIRSIVKNTFIKRWHIFTTFSYGGYAKILNNSDLITKGPLENKPEYKIVSIFEYIHLTLMQIKRVDWFNKSLAFKIIYSSLMERKRYTPRVIADYIPGFVAIVGAIWIFIFLFIYSLPSIFIDHYNVSQQLTGNRSRSLPVEFFEYVHSNASVLSLFLLLLAILSVTFYGTVIILRDKHLVRNNDQIPSVYKNEQLYQIIVYLYHLYDLDIYDSKNVLKDHINSIESSINNFGHEEQKIDETYNWNQKDTVKSEYINQYTKFIPPIVAGAYLIPVNHLNSLNYPSLWKRVKQFWHGWKDLALWIGIFLLSIYWLFQLLGFNINDQLMNILIKR
jgi:membrane protein